MQGASILYYELQWDQGTNGVSWESYSIMTAVPGQTFITIQIGGLESGVTYQFNYRAQNIHGWSIGFSPAVVIQTLSEPLAI